MYILALYHAEAYGREIVTVKERETRSFIHVCYIAKTTI
jgi:hypothetical protein